MNGRRDMDGKIKYNTGLEALNFIYQRPTISYSLECEENGFTRGKAYELIKEKLSFDDSMREEFQI